MEKAHNPLPLYDSRRTIARAFGPLRDLTESDAMLHCGSMDGDNELSHRALRPELCNGERNGCSGSGKHYSALFVFCSP
jgi:hypothetical protein